MPFRFRKSLKIGKGIRVNLSKSGISTTFGKRGASLNVSNRGTRVTTGIPGTGFSFSKLFGGSKKKNIQPAAPETYQTRTFQPPTLNKVKKKIPLSALIIGGFAAFALQISLCLSAASSVFGGSPTAVPTLDLVSVQGTALADAWISYTQTVQAMPTSTIISTETLLPTLTLEPATLAPTSTSLPTATLIVFPTNTLFVLPAATLAPQGAVCSCNGDSLNCTDFGSWSSAQACYSYCQSQGVGDIHGLDGNNDGSACDSLR